MKEEEIQSKEAPQNTNSLKQTLINLFYFWEIVNVNFNQIFYDGFLDLLMIFIAYEIHYAAEVEKTSFNDIAPSKNNEELTISFHLHSQRPLPHG